MVILIANIYRMQPYIFRAKGHVYQRRHMKDGGALISYVVDDNLLIKNDVGILSSIKIWLFTRSRWKSRMRAIYSRFKVFKDCKDRKITLR